MVELRAWSECPHAFAERDGVGAHGAQLLAHALAHELGAQVARLDKLAEALLHVPQREEVEALAQRRRERRAMAAPKLRTST